MNSMSTAYSAYQSVDLHTQIEGASPHELINLLYRGALDRLAKARGYLNSGNAAAKGEEISKVISILVALKGALDPSLSAEFTQQLDSLYNYLIELVVNANTNNDLERLDEASKLLSHIHESWNLIATDLRTPPRENA